MFNNLIFRVMKNVENDAVNGKGKRKIAIVCVAVVSLCVVAFGCDKLRNPQTGTSGGKGIEGTYSGTFTVNYSDGTGKSTGATTLELKNGRYTCTGNHNRVPAGGSGTYSISNGKIIFADEIIWTCDFDHGLILNGECGFTFDGKNLKFSQDFAGYALYEYDFVKVKHNANP